MFIYSKHYPLMILIKKQQVAELLGNKESIKKKSNWETSPNETIHNQSFFLLVTGLGKMASIMRLRRRFILREGVSFSSVLFSVLARGLARGERKLISTGGGGFGVDFVLLKRWQKIRVRIKLRQDDAQPTHYLIANLAFIVCQCNNLL